MPRATGIAPVAHTAMLLAAWQGDEAAAAGLIATIAADATQRGLGRLVNSADYAKSVLYNGLGQHEIACEAARRAFERDVIGHGPLVVAELVEAASRTGHTEPLESALEWFSERSRATPSEWALGIEARIHALLSKGDAADGSPRVDRPAPAYRCTWQRRQQRFVLQRVDPDGVAASSRGRLHHHGRRQFMGTHAPERVRGHLLHEPWPALRTLSPQSRDDAPGDCRAERTVAKPEHAVA